jgi:hypothetical protein
MTRSLLRLGRGLPSELADLDPAVLAGIPSAPDPSPSPEGVEQPPEPAGIKAAGATTTGPKPVRKSRRNDRRKIPRGRLDETARVEFLMDPLQTNVQLAAKLRCHPKTLGDRRKCPRLCDERRKLKSERNQYREKPVWHDRRPDDDGDA